MTNPPRYLILWPAILNAFQNFWAVTNLLQMINIVQNLCHLPSVVPLRLFTLCHCVEDLTSSPTAVNVFAIIKNGTEYVSHVQRGHQRLLRLVFFHWHAVAGILSAEHTSCLEPTISEIYHVVRDKGKCRLKQVMSWIAHEIYNYILDNCRKAKLSDIPPAANCKLYVQWKR